MVLMKREILCGDWKIKMSGKMSLVKKISMEEPNKEEFSTLNMINFSKYSPKCL